MLLLIDARLLNELNFSIFLDITHEVFPTRRIMLAVKQRGLPIALVRLHVIQTRLLRLPTSI